MARFVPYAQAQQYLFEKYNKPPVSIRQQRTQIIERRFPKPIEISPGRLAFTDEQLDAHAESLLAQAAQHGQEAAE
jgi:hypothetical protein